MASPGLALAAAVVAAIAPAPAKVPATSTERQPVRAPVATPTPAPAPAAAPANPCCASAFATPLASSERPLTIAIESGLQVGRLGLTGHKDGEAAIDPQTGAKIVGPNMVDLGGLSFQGKATVTGQPLRPVRIVLPASVELHSPTGGEAQLTQFRTDLPPVALLDAHGTLVFAFGATLSTKGAQGGTFRGRIPIRVEYY